MELSSLKILGYSLSMSLSLEGSIVALEMALAELGDVTGVIHHSDRGVQYCSKGYVGILESKGIRISMSSRGNLYENANVERLNGILKEEFMLNRVFNDFNEADVVVKEAISIYNNEQPHMSIGILTPSQRYAVMHILTKERSKKENYYNY